MKTFLITLLCFGLAFGFIYYIESQPVPPLRTKRVAEKLMPVERAGSSSYSQTVYYLLADDGSHVEVGMGTYARTKVGQLVSSRGWKGGAAQ